MLEVAGLSVSYGQHRALEGASLSVGKGEIVVILGANGAGKTTLLKALSGVCEGRVTGEVRLDGVEVTGRPPHEIVEEGLALVPEGRGVFPDLTVQENLTLGAYAARARDEEAGNLERVYRLFPKLEERRRQVVRTMSGGEQQMVAIGRAMMSNPSILALDEPSLGLSPLLCKELFQSLKAVRGAGLGILLVEQNARQSLAISDRGYLLENGHVTHHASAEDLMHDPAVQKAYLGGAAASAATRPAASAAAVAAQPAPKPAGASAAPRHASSPSDIAAQAMAGFQSKHPTPAPGPVPVPTPSPAAARPTAPPPQAAQAAASSPSAPPTPPRTDPYKIDTASLVARAASKADRRPGANGGANGGGNGMGNGRLPTPPAAQPVLTPSTRTPMPDLNGSASERLEAMLKEIEDAARRAESYRPRRDG